MNSPLIPFSILPESLIITMFRQLPFLLLSLTTASDLLSYSFWSAFDQAIYDQAGRNNHGVNGFSLSPESVDAQMTPQGAYFDGALRGIMVPGNGLQANAVQIGSGFTLLWWLWPSELNGVLLDKAPVNPAELPLIRVEMQFGKLVTSLKLNSAVQTVSSVGLINLNAWNMVTVTVLCTNSLNICLVNQYINGANVGTVDQSLSGALIDDPNMSVYVGTLRNGLANYKGYLYQFRWIEGSLQPIDIAGLYGASGSPSCTGCLHDCVTSPFQCLPLILPGETPVLRPACESVCVSLCTDTSYTCFSMSSSICNSACITCLTQPSTQCLTCSLPSAVADTATHTCVCGSGYLPTSISPLACTSKH